MSDASAVCAAAGGLSSNPDISGPGVRIALYLQSLLSIVLIRYSPGDAPGAYWCMTSTALSLVISAIITSIQRSISLLDAIVVVYVLLLPILASAFGISEIISASESKHALRKVHSPLLIIANWTRSVFTYSFAIYVWVTAPTFGSGPPECNTVTKLIFFGASLPALGSGRVLNLVGWGLLTLLFLYRSIRGFGTIWLAFKALFSPSAGQTLLKPKRPVENEVHLEAVDTYNYGTGARTHRERAYRPRQVFHEVLKGMINQILGWAPSGEGRWYKTYGQAILTCLLAGWAIAMTELELLLNDQTSINNQWGFGQVLPLVLTIAPLFSLYENFLARHSAGPREESTRTVRFSIRGANGLQRPSTELDGLPEDYISQLSEEIVEATRAPSPFAVITIDERDIYVTYDQQDTHNPDWAESFDVEVGDLSTVVVRIFDLKCMDAGRPSLIGYTTLLPFSVLPPPSAEAVGPVTQADEADAVPVVHAFQLVRDGVTLHEATVSITLSMDTEGPLPPPKLPPRFRGLKETREDRRVEIIKFRGKRIGSKKTTTTETYWLP